NIDYVLYEFSEAMKTMYNTVEKPFKSLELSGNTLVNCVLEDTENDDYTSFDKDYSGTSFTINGTSEGAIKSAILKGQTLVNCLKPQSGNYTDYQISSTYKDLTLFKPNTLYTFINNWDKGGTLAIRNNNGQITNVNFTKNSSRLFTTPSAITNVEIYSVNSTHGGTSSDCEKWKTAFIVIEGDHTNVDIPYFEGMQSVKMPVLCTTGKNLFGSSTEIVTGQGINSTNGLPYNTSSHSCTGFLRVKSNTTYTITQSHNRTWVFAYNKNKEYIKVVKTDILSGGNFTTPNDTHYIRLDVNTVDTSEIVNGVQIEEGAVATPYEPHKTNILSTPEEVVLRSLPNGVKDTLNLNTGEYVKRIGEVTYTGKDTEGWRESVANYESNDIDSFYTYIHNPQSSVVSKHCHCNLFPVYHNLPSNPTFEYFHILNAGSSQIVIGIKRSKLSSQDLTGIKAWLQANPLTIQYELATPIVKTVDLSTSGNWEKVILDGKSSEDWKQNSHSGNFVQFEGYSNFCLYSMNLPVSNRGLLCDKLSYYGYDSKFRHTKVEGISDGGGYRLIFVRVKTEKLPTNDVAGFKQWLSQNPIEVSYMLSSNKDSTQVKQPIFFKDGHIVQSSGAENSLIPTLDYQAKTSNSYVMDLMKTNTKYTMKAKSASGTFTIDGTSYGAGTNSTFTTPS
ncbi:MAG: hypothetical protein SO274_09840, partial [Turicibacter bilis]|nr:hypothetical protein [Turicibacter bilis]